MARTMEDIRAYDRIRGRKRMDLVRDYKAVSGCKRCAERDPDCLELHHIDPATKSPRLKIQNGPRAGKQQSIYNLGWADALRELEKCEVLCANCHAKEEAAKRREKYADRWANAPELTAPQTK